MKFKTFILIPLFLLGCTGISNLNVKKSFTANGFAYIYNAKDYNEKLINKKFNNEEKLIGHQFLKIGSSIKITNPSNNKSVIYKNNKKVLYPEFYTVLITEPIAQELGLDKDLPYIRLDVVKKNKSFIAKKAKTFNEEKKIHIKAPVEHVKIDNISKKKSSTKKNAKIFSILVGEFSSIEVVKYLKERILKETVELDRNKLKILVKRSNKVQLILSPYKSIESMKRDYIELKKFGFEELDILANE
tara:strand:- start:49 stop:783 length:735 start_codon:yes stop_codon:yes gene_type:complete